MQLRLLREPTVNHATLGMLCVDGFWACWTLEDEVRVSKQMNVTAIPEGLYPVILDQSQRFGRLMPHILNVPGFEGIRIHAGNTVADTAGCVLVGATRADAFVGQSKIAFDALFRKLQSASGPVTLTVEPVLRPSLESPARNTNISI